MKKLIVSFALAAAATACFKKEEAPPPPPPPVQEQAPAPSTPPLESSFQPPADGKLLQPQVELYVAVRKKAAEKEAGTESAPAPPASVPGPDPEVVLAKELGYDPGEYAWVRGAVSRAAQSGFRKGMLGMANAMLAEQERQLEASLSKASDAEQKKLLEEQIRANKEAQVNLGKQASAPSPEITYNRELLRKNINLLKTIGPDQRQWEMLQSGK